MNQEVSCSQVSEAVGEQLAGSTPHAVAWVALEQSGPWGAKAFTDSHLDPALGQAIEAAAASHQTRPALIRRPGRHADKHAHGEMDPRHVLIAFTHPGNTWLLEGVVDRPHDLIGVDWAALEDGDADGVRRSLPSLSPSDRSHLLVCTNGTRDVCCAAKGRPVALGVAARFPAQVWEVTHTSGHRFAPTAVLLPAGTLHGRMDQSAAVDLLVGAGRGETVLTGSRGRSTWPAPAQVAELAVRDATGERSLSALVVTAHEAVGTHAWTTVVGHTDGRAWRVETRSVETDERRAESCGKALQALRAYTTALTPLPR